MSASTARPPFLYYALVFLTGGLFAYIWILLLARDINRMSERSIFNLKALSALVGLLLIVIAVCVAILLSHLITAPAQQNDTMSLIANIGTVASILLYVTTLVLAAAIYRSLLSKKGEKFTMSALVKIIFLTFVMYISLPYLQTLLNGFHDAVPLKN